MKKASFVLFLFTYCLLPIITPVYASTFDVIPPVKAPFSKRQPAPAGDLKSTFPGFSPNNIDEDITVSCTRTYSISQTFDPKKVTTTTTDANGNPITSESYQPYDVTEVQNAANLPRPESNPHKRQLSFYQTNIYDVCASGEVAQDKLRSYKLGDGANLSARTNRDKTQDCLKGQRLAKAALALSTNYALPNNSTNDQPIAYDQGGSCTSRKSTGTPIFLSQVAYSLRNEKIFYSPSGTCTRDAKLTTLSGVINAVAQSLCKPTFADEFLSKLASKGGTSYAKDIFRNLPTTDNGPSQEKFIANRIGIGSKIEPTKVPFNTAFGGINNPNTVYTNNNLIRKGQELVTRDICANLANNDTADEKSPISFLAYVKNFIEHITDQSKTITKSISVEHIFSKDVQPVADTSRTEMLNYVPQRHQTGVDQLNQNSTSDKVTASYGYDNSIIFRLYQRYFYRRDQQQKLGIL